ncbi:unnamed protein product [Ophioblennius macclurei]
MDSTDQGNDAAATRRRSPRNLPYEVSVRAPITRSRTKDLKAQSNANLSPSGSQDEDVQTGKTPLDTRSEKGDWNNEYVPESPETMMEVGQRSSDPSSLRPTNEATTPLGAPTRVASQTTFLRNRQIPQGSTKAAENRGTINGSSLERPDVNREDAPVEKKNLVRPTIRKEAQPNVKGSTRTSASKTKSTGSSSSCFVWSLMGLILLLISSAVFFVIMSKHRSSDNGGTRPTRVVKLEQFHEHLKTLESSYPHQRYELWHRSKIHLEKHLKTKEPTEPVSLIFVAGRSAEKTLRCLALDVASSFSFALNASVHSIDGVAQAGYDGDEVKLDIDNQLQAAFEGEKPAAVIHRLEELPPSSTLIFYRYCDHESAAYKDVFLLFTVLLPHDEISSDRSLTEVEEMVQDHLLKKLVDSSQTGFNKMDTDKFSGLWSRISHLILPVASEEEMEKKGCKL